MAEFASKGVAGAGLGTGIAGLALGVLNGGLGGILNGGIGPREGYMCSENTPVNRFELQQEQVIASKDAEIAMLKADQRTDSKFLEFYQYTDTKFNALEKENAKQREYIASKFGEQSVMNERIIGKLETVSTVVASQGARLDSITFTAVNETKICNPCCNY